MTLKVSTGILITVVLGFAVAVSAPAKEWAIVTLADMPDYSVAGRPLKLTFFVRQNGQTLRTGLRPQVRATTAAGLTVKTNAIAGTTPGEYTAVLNIAQAGDWTIVIASGISDSVLKLPAMKVIVPGSVIPVAFSPATRGLRLFASKGCVGCHRHVEVNPERAGEPQLDLTGKRFPQNDLRQFLADPSSKPGGMPNLKLRTDEIDALIAFIDKLVYKTRGQEER